MRVPKDFPDASLAGKKVEFSITFHEIRDTVPHQPDEAFAKSQGFETLEALRTEVKKSLVDSGEVLAELVLRKTLMAELGKTSSFEVPDSWVQSTLASLKKAHIRKIQAANPDASHDESVIDATIEKDLCERALRNVRADCVVQKVISENSFPVKDTELLNYARAMAQSEGKSLDEVVSILRKNKDMIDRISQDIQERKALLWISNQCTKEDKEVDLKTLNNRFNQEPSL
jgi:trigger factor